VVRDCVGSHCSSTSHRTWLIEPLETGEMEKACEVELGAGDSQVAVQDQAASVSIGGGRRRPGKNEDDGRLGGFVSIYDGCFNE
jgi:hypothetical protein